VEFGSYACSAGPYIIVYRKPNPMTARTLVSAGLASGRLHVSAPSLLGRLRLAPMLPGFLAEQTQVSIDLMLVDRPVRLAEEGIDVALRIGPLEDSGLIVRKLDDISLLSAPRRMPGIPARPSRPASPARR
jgi:DNA-binding transcriptional LysR family regulator